MKGVGDGEKLLCMICIRCSPHLTATPSSREVPNLKHQGQKQMQGQTARRPVLSLEFGASLELGAWNLELVARALSFSGIEMRPTVRFGSGAPVYSGMSSGRTSRHSS